MAHISQDAAMLEAFRQGRDIHAATAAAIYNIPLKRWKRTSAGTPKPSTSASSTA